MSSPIYDWYLIGTTYTSFLYLAMLTWVTQIRDGGGGGLPLLLMSTAEGLVFGSGGQFGNTPQDNVATSNGKKRKTMGS